ncbi:hypothetical protein GMOD_00002353 [Pyrenophora seminiperda CCB06]|uniref:Uncharacterized protein n=1 Tax=Pyrenophora seminiperda CCB06 TaxID=1302712 RepID=A0A3M7LXJ6_9PLEO|nr:hypothetical protein GMOD_00002353 [Pyrenophora seminiperda CCB06]
MKKLSLRKTLLSLLGLAPRNSRAQRRRSSWGAAYTINASSTDTLLPSKHHTRSGQPYIRLRERPSSQPTAVQTGLAIDTSPPVVLRASGVTLVSGEAGAAGGRGYRRMGFSGTIAGAAGVMA